MTHQPANRRSSTSSVSASESQKRYQARKKGELPQVQYLPLDQALEVLQ